ncbi:MAG: amidohydrolase family protein [Anaerolineae bacterium]|nr:amidohydrolase family protein [Anaerolineae bacterium]
MIIDANAWLGHWPFRQLRHNDVPGLLRFMDANGIEAAVVASIHGIFYKNCHRANEELAEQVAGHRDRLIPFATLNPNYPGWQRNLRLCHEELGMRGLRLYPAYHQYDLTDSASLELIGAATELGFPIALPMRVVDVRQRHWMDTERNLTVPEIEAVVQACPRTSFVILNGLGLESSLAFEPDRNGSRQVMADLSRMTAVLANNLGAMIANFGPGSVVFGTGMPFKYPRPALLKLEILEADQATKEAISHGNMERLLSL